MSSTAIFWQKDGHSALWQHLKQQQRWDVIVVGGGITGAGVAREAVKHGLKTLLLERQDFAWGTSSRSSKMVHGGLRYMAQGDIQTTRHSVHERERLMQEAPGLVDLMSYAMPHYKGQFPPALAFNALLWVYDFFAGKRYRQYFNAKEFAAQTPVLSTVDLTGGTQFADAVTDDSRLVMRVLHEAINEGACCINYVAAQKLILRDDRVRGLSIINEQTRESLEVFADVVINATGAWADELRGQLQQPKKIRPARGSHLVVSHDRLPVTQSLTILHPEDKRPIFIYPWEGRTVIGTTDIDNGGINNTEARISQGELDYLLRLTEHYFPTAQITVADIIATFSGVRPLIAGGALNPSKEKRNHSVWVDKGLVSVSGGKLTTFRLIALDALKAAKPYLTQWPQEKVNARIFTATDCDMPQFKALSQPTQRRLLGYYGNALALLLKPEDTDEMETVEGLPLLWAELRYGAAYEQVQHLDDLLLRRTRLGLLVKQGGDAIKDKIKSICQEELGWDDKRWQEEWQRYQRIWHEHYYLPSRASGH